MPKIITARRLQGETEKAQEYVKTHILFPSGLIGLICILTGTAALVYQFFTDTYGWPTFLQSTGLILAGAVLGWAQTRYHRFLLREYPGYFAERMRLFTRGAPRRGKREAGPPALEHRGRNIVPLLYVVGITALLSLSLLASMIGEVYYVAALLLPWAGFFWAKLFFWRGVLQRESRR